MNAIQRHHKLDQRPRLDEIERAMPNGGRLKGLLGPAVCTRAGVGIDALAGTLQADGAAARETRLRHMQQVADQHGAPGAAPV